MKIGIVVGSHRGVTKRQNWRLLSQRDQRAILAHGLTST